MDNKKSVNILIYGDEVNITNLLLLPSSGKRFEEVAQTNEEGGILFLHKVIDKILVDDNIFPNDNINPTIKDNIKYIIKEYKWSSKDNELMLIWKPMIQDKKNNSSNLVWRIYREIGQISKSSGENQNVYSKNNDDIKKNKWDYLIINDQNFRNTENSNNKNDDFIDFFEKMEPSFFSNLKQIFLRTSFHDNQMNLIKELLKISNISEKLSIFTNYSEITSNEFSIHCNSSWELVLQDIIRECEEGIIKTLLNTTNCINQIFVYFSEAGVVVIDNNDKDNDKDHQITLYYDPYELKDTLFVSQPGITFGDITILISTLLKKHMIEDYLDDKVSLYVAINSAFRMIREKHLIGRGKYNLVNNNKKIYGFDKKGDSTISKKIRRCSLCGKCNLFEEKEENLQKKCLEKSIFRTIPDKYNIHGNINDNSKKTLKNKILLEDFIGYGKEKWLQIGSQIVKYGLDKILNNIPKGVFGKYITYDHEEIEHLNNIKSLVLTYCENYLDTTPLAIAVFGAPGTGKSFIIRELAKCIHTTKDIKNIDLIEYNLSQVQNESEIYRMLHQVRNISISNKIPLIIWDEFDVEKMKWLKIFLEPIQDGKFSDNGVIYDVGKSIFAFCGGCFKSFSDFTKDVILQNDKKGLDFVSRIRAYLNLFGLNRSFNSFENLFKFSSEYKYIIQRAVIIRTQLERYWPNIIDEKTQEARIDPYITQALLRTEKFYYGARSIETILKVCNLSEQSNLTTKTFPMKELVNTHVTQDFFDYIYGVNIDILKLAQARHKKWYENRESQGYKLGNIRVEKGNIKLHPAFWDNWYKLTNITKNRNIRSTENFISNIYSMGYVIDTLNKENNLKVNTGSDSTESQTLTKKEIEDILPKLEHEYWLIEHCIKGWEKGDIINECKLIHKNVKAYDKFSEGDKIIYKSVVESGIKSLIDQGYSIVRGYNLGKILYIGLIGNGTYDDKNTFSKILSKINSFKFKEIQVLTNISNFSIKLINFLYDEYNKNNDFNFRFKVNVFLPYEKDIIGWLEILKKYNFMQDLLIEDASFLFKADICNIVSLIEQINFTNEIDLKSLFEKINNEQKTNDKIFEQNLIELISKIDSYIIRMSDLIFLQYTDEQNINKSIAPLKDKIIDQEYNNITNYVLSNNILNILTLRKSIFDRYIVDNI